MSISLALTCCQSNCQSLTVQEFTNLADKTNGWTSDFNIKKDTVLGHETSDGVNDYLFSYNTVLYPETLEGEDVFVRKIYLNRYGVDNWFVYTPVLGNPPIALLEGDYYVANYGGLIRLFDNINEAILYQTDGSSVNYLTIEDDGSGVVDYIADLDIITNGTVVEDTEFTQVVKFEITDPNGNVYDVVDEYKEAMITAIEANNYTDITFIITSAMLGSLAGSNLTDGHYKINYDILSYLNGEAGNEIQFNYFNVCNIKGCVDKYIKDLPVYYNCTNCNNEYVKRFEKIYHLYLAVKNAVDCGNYVDATNILRMVQKLCNYKYCKNC